MILKYQFGLRKGCANKMKTMEMSKQVNLGTPFEKSLIFILHELHMRTSRFNDRIQISEFEKSVLDRAKLERKRRNLTLADALEEGVAIYKRQAHSIDQLIEELDKRDWIDIGKEFDQEMMCLTSKGKDYILSVYTDNYSKEYLLYKEQVQQTFIDINEPPYEDDLIARFFYFDKSFEKQKKRILHDSEERLSRHLQESHVHNLNLLNYPSNEEQLILHLVPKFFLSWEDAEEEVELEIDGIPLLQQEAIEMGRPYPNKRYAVPYIKVEKEKIYGLYIPLKKDAIQVPQKITLRWKIGDYKIVVHCLTIKFNQQIGHFFSTHQSLWRSTSIPALDLITTDIMSFYDGGFIYQNRKFSISEEDDITNFDEEVELTSMPLHLHYNNL